VKILNCPLNGLRNISEFAYGGEVQAVPFEGDAEAWNNYLFNCRNAPGVTLEWWCHTPTNYWFVAERNTLTGEILETHPANTVPDRAVPNRIGGK
jgi:sarcosine oxidase subunit delta